MFGLAFEGLLRCGKSCRLRWINYLRADLKRGNITAGEEEIIINLHATLGNRLVRHFPPLLSIAKRKPKPENKLSLLSKEYINI